MQSETVLLDTMTGFDFEEFFAHLLSALGRGTVEKVLFTQDEGRDILLRTKTGLLVVECKHHPNSSIGRPIVQKLHSAVISSGANSGILVTTGHFTREALAYAQKISPPIEMIDRPLLTDMAARAGITIISGGQKLTIWTFPLPDLGVTRVSLGQYLESVLESHPRPARSLVRDIYRTVRYRPIYVVTYDIHAVFSTSVGVIHTESARQAKLAIDGTNGELLDQTIKDFIVTETQSPVLGVLKETASELPSFGLDAVTAQTHARAMITRLHTRTKRYWGRNNRGYTRVCEPGERDIFIADIRQVQLPLVDLRFKLLETGYDAAILQGPSGRLLNRKTNVTTCRVCNSQISGLALVCDTCGRSTHRKRLLAGRSHGFQCHKCKRTTCRLDGRWSFRWLIFTKLLCQACAQEAIQKGRKVYYFKSLPSQTNVQMIESPLRAR